MAVDSILETAIYYMKLSRSVTDRSSITTYGWYWMKAFGSIFELLIKIETGPNVIRHFEVSNCDFRDEFDLYLMSLIVAILFEFFNLEGKAKCDVGESRLLQGTWGQTQADFIAH